MNGGDLLDRLRVAFDVPSDQALAAWLGISQPYASSLRRSEEVTARQITNLILCARKTALKFAITPIVEQFPLDKTKSRGPYNYEIFSTSDGNGGTHPYTRGLRDELESNHGVYIFYDSRGRALYVGKAEKRTLWGEIKDAFNRSRNTQSVRRVWHPTRKKAFKTTREKARQVVKRQVRLHELAAFISAYEVEPALIGEVEAMLVRSFANDLLNVKMEKFSSQRGW